MIGCPDAPSPALVDFCRKRFAQSSGDARLLMPVLKGLTKREVLSHVPRFMTMSKEQLAEFVNRALTVKEIYEHPSELMLRFFSTTKEEAGCDERQLLLHQNDAITTALAHSRYKRDVVGLVLRKLSDQSPVHPLYMKTAMAAAKRYPDLVKWLLDSALPKLIAQRVWKDPILWRGVVKFCIGTIPKGSVAVLLRLPSDVIQTLIEEEGTQLVAPMRRYVKDHPKSASTAVKRMLRGKN